MAENSAAGGVVKFGLGLGVGFGLYLLIRNFGFGGGLGLGGGGARGEGQAPSAPGPSETPPIPQDEQPLLFWVEPSDDLKQRGERSKLADPASRTRDDARFYLLDLSAVSTADQLKKRVSELVKKVLDKELPPLSLDDVVARIKAGGRDDARLMSSGAILSGTWDDAREALLSAGIKHWLLWEERPADRKPGDPPKLPRWDLFDEVWQRGTPPSKGSAYWNLRGTDPAPHVSGVGRGQYRTNHTISVGRGSYRR